MQIRRNSVGRCAHEYNVSVSAYWRWPRWWAIALTIVGVVLFVRAGFWQLDRAEEKERLLAAFAQASTAAPTTLEQGRRIASATTFPRVAINGHYDSAHTYLLDNQTRGGRVGVVAYAVFEPADGSTALLVDRGFRAVASSSGKIPPPPDTEQTLSGLYAPPPAIGLRMGGDALPTQVTWPKRTIRIDLAEISADLGRKLDDRVLLLDPDPSSGFERTWQPESMPPARHRAYAFQWFSLAIAAIVLFGVMHWRRNKK